MFVQGALEIPAAIYSTRLANPVFSICLTNFDDTIMLESDHSLRVLFSWGKLFYLQLELFCLQLSFFAYSPLRPLLTHFPTASKKAPIVSKEAKTASKKAPIVSKKAKIVNCK